MHEALRHPSTHNVRVPARVVDAVALTEIEEAVMVGVAVYCTRVNLTEMKGQMHILTNVELREALDVAARGVAMNGAEVARNLDLALGADVLEVLVAKNDNLALGNVKRELIKTGR